MFNIFPYLPALNLLLKYFPFKAQSKKKIVQRKRCVWFWKMLSTKSRIFFKVQFHNLREETFLMDSSALRLRQAPISSPPSSLLNVLDICNRKKAAINGLRTSYIRKVSVSYTLLILWTEYLSLFHSTPLCLTATDSF